MPVYKTTPEFLETIGRLLDGRIDTTNAGQRLTSKEGVQEITSSPPCTNIIYRFIYWLIGDWP